MPCYLAAPENEEKRQTMKTFRSSLLGSISQNTAVWSRLSQRHKQQHVFPILLLCTIEPLAQLGVSCLKESENQKKMQTAKQLSLVQLMNACLWGESERSEILRMS
jgi:hypothetical protein